MSVRFEGGPRGGSPERVRLGRLDRGSVTAGRGWSCGSRGYPLLAQAPRWSFSKLTTRTFQRQSLAWVPSV